MNRPYEDHVKVDCLTAESPFADGWGGLDFHEDDAQVLITPANSDQICLDARKAYELGLWLIAAASRIEGRCPESMG